MTGQRYPHRLLSAGGGNKNSGSMTGGAGTGVDGDTTPQYQVIGCAFNHRYKVQRMLYWAFFGNKWQHSKEVRRMFTRYVPA